MSGTSLDGLDVAYCQFFRENNRWQYAFLAACTYAYSESLREALKKAHTLSSIELLRLDVEYAEWVSARIREFILTYSVSDIDLIASHGHTVFHQPEYKISWQIGNPYVISAILQVPVVGNFRSLDVAMGGQGAPLVPVGDEHLFGEYDACVNLGGFSNISFVDQGKRVAMDICPVNIILNEIAMQKGKQYDENGESAIGGAIIPALFELLNNLAFYKKTYPKSLSREWLEEEFKPLVPYDRFSHRDIAYTFYEHIVFQITRVLDQYNFTRVLFTGGGTFNTYLMNKIKEKTKANVIIPSDVLVAYKEALVFAFLGLLNFINETNVYSSVTGSARDHIGGVLVKYPKG